MGSLHPVLLLRVVDDQRIEDIQRRIKVLFIEVEEAGEVVPLFFRQLAFALMHGNCCLNVLKRQIIFFNLIIALSQ